MLSSVLTQAALLAALVSKSNASPVKRQAEKYPNFISLDFPDPSGIQASDGAFYFYATAGNNKQIQMAKANSINDLPEYQDADGLGGSVNWGADSYAIWAPDVTPASDGTYWMYFGTTGGKHGNQCIGFATSDDPLGPFMPQDDPWLCDELGVIDAEQFHDDDGKRYVLYKVDGNNQGQDTPIMIQEVDAGDGYSKIGDPVEILNRDEEDGPLVEAPSLQKVDGTYYLTFSSNMYDSTYYDTSFATASSVTGPYTKAKDPDAPILATGIQGLIGPGGADLIGSDSGMLMVFHGWNKDPKSDEEGKARYPFAVGVTLSDGKITVDF